MGRHELLVSGKKPAHDGIERTVAANERAAQAIDWAHIRRRTTSDQRFSHEVFLSTGKSSIDDSGGSQDLQGHFLFGFVEAFEVFEKGAGVVDIVRQWILDS